MIHFENVTIRQSIRKNALENRKIRRIATVWSEYTRRTYRDTTNCRVYVRSRASEVSLVENTRRPAWVHGQSVLT